MAVPNTFASATSAIPLANLDANFAYYDAGFSLSGTAVTFAGSITLTTGTANGVPYLNASKVLTSSGVLTFNGTILSSTGFAGALNGTVGATTANTGAFTTLSTTGEVTITGGTANGVAYLNGSKVLTTGAALVFDGSSLSVGTASTIPGIGNTIVGFSASGSTGYIAASRASGSVGFFNRNSDGDIINLLSSGTTAATFGLSSGALTFGLSSGEAMRLTSAGLGIGTTSPQSKLSVQDSWLSSMAGSGGVQDVPVITNYIASTLKRGSINFGVASGGSTYYSFYVGATTTPPEVMRIDSSGNLLVGTTTARTTLTVAGSISLGATPAAATAGTAYSIIGNSASAGNANGGDLTIVAGGGTGSGTNGNLVLRAGQTGSTGSVTTGGNLILESGKPSDSQTSGYIAFNSYAGGPAIAVERMRLDSAGNLGLGVTPSAWNTNKRAFQIGSRAALWSDSNITTGLSNNVYVDTVGSKYLQTAAATNYRQQFGEHAWLNAPSGTAGTAITFTQAMTLDISGNLGVGTTSPAGADGKAIVIYNGAGAARLALKNNGTGDASGDGFQLAVSGTTAYIEQREASPLVFTTSNTEVMRLDASGNLGIGQSSPSQKLDVTGNILVNVYSLGAGNGIFFRKGLETNAQPSITLQDHDGSAPDGLSVNGGDGVSFRVGGTERGRFELGGNLLVGITSNNANGGVLQLKSGITFPATAVAATDANTLDDYEEGTWTPNQGAGLTVVGTFSSTGNYVKVGKMVTVQVSLLAATSITISAGDAIIFTNLPFGSSPTRNPGVAVNTAHSAGLFVDIASTTVYSCGTLVASQQIFLSITYQTS